VVANTQEEPVTLPSTAIGAGDIAISPAWLPLDATGPGDITLVRLDEAAYRAASFLDQRLLATNPAKAVVASATVAAAAAKLTPRAHYIFHVGHVGSTLVSRLVGEVEGLFSVREPAILRAEALQPARDWTHGAAVHGAEIQGAGARWPEIHGGTQLRDTLSLLARTWRPGQRAVVKATSFVSEIAEPILEMDKDAAAILMFTPALAYLLCILGGPNSRVESRALAPVRLARLRRRLGEGALGMPPETEGEWIASGWLCEMACLQQAARRFASRILWVDFDEFLAAPGTSLKAMLAALGASVEPDNIDRILAGPLMHRYSKAPEHAYDAALRREVLASSEREHAAEIRRGMAWLTALGARQRVVAEALGH